MSVFVFFKLSAIVKFCDLLVSHLKYFLRQLTSHSEKEPRGASEEDCRADRSNEGAAEDEQAIPEPGQKSPQPVDNRTFGFGCSRKLRVLQIFLQLERELEKGKKGKNLIGNVVLLYYRQGCSSVSEIEFSFVEVYP